MRYLPHLAIPFALIFTFVVMVFFVETPPPEQPEQIEIHWAVKSDFNLVTIIKNFVRSESEKYQIDPNVAMAIISCEGGFEDPKTCNNIYGCIAGQGHFQWIPSSWDNVINADYFPLPDYCRTTEAVFISECNIIAGVFMLSIEGDKHWRSWSGGCYLPKLDMD